VTDDAELRARIEAQVAARRADAASSDADETPDTHAQDLPESSASARGGKALTPTRPWQPRGAAEESESTQDEPVAEADVDSRSTTARRGGVGPARPWAKRSAQASKLQDELSGEPLGETSTDESAGRLHPARPWRGRPATEQARAESGTAAPAPSHPHVVLHGISDEDAGGTPAPPPRMRGLLQRGAGKRRVDDNGGAGERQLEDESGVASRDLAKRRAEAELRLAEAERELAEQRAEAKRLRVEREDEERILAERRAAMEELPETTAVYVPDDEAVGAFAEAAGALQDQPVQDAEDEDEPGGRWARRRRKPKDLSIAAEFGAAPVAEPTADVEESDAAEVEQPAAVAAEPVVAATTPLDEEVAEAAAEESYPWQQKDEVDLDLHGAPTWDPGMYPPEDEAPQQLRGLRALRWLLAREPEPPAVDVAAPTAKEPTPEPTEPAAYEPERVELPVAHLPVEDLGAREMPPAIDESAAEVVEPAPAAEVAAPAADVAAEPVEKQRVSLFGRLRRRAEEPEDESEEAFALPPVDEAWLEPPKPTRDWASRTPPIEVGANPDEIAAVVAKPEPEPEPEPEPAVHRRPSPGAAAAVRRPSPEAVAAAALAPVEAAVAEPAAEPRRRPRPGAAPAAAAAATSTRPGRPMPFELAGGAAPTTFKAQMAPDISRFLEATEADEDEGQEVHDDKTGRGGGDGRWRKTLTRSGVTLLIAALAAVLLRVFIVQPYYIPSASMEPTLHGCPGCNDDHVLVDKISYDVHGVRTGDIVVFHKPENAQVPEDVLIKRVIALGGDRISMTKGRVYINGGLLDEGYLNIDHTCYATDPSENFAPRTVPNGDVFVMGDNRCNSEDSREFGPIKTSSIIGRAFMIVWPLNRVGFLGS
jgi:signal peptidase I